MSCGNVPAGKRVSARLTVQFGGADEGASSAELRLQLDGRPGGLNAGKTSFVQGDSPGYLLFRSAVDLLIHWTDGGVIQSHGATLYPVEDLLYFGVDHEQQLSQAPAGAVVLDMLGDAVPVGLQLVQEGRRVRAYSNGAAVEALVAVRARYATLCEQYRVVGIPPGRQSLYLFAAGVTSD